MTLSRRHFLAGAGLAGGTLLANVSVPALARAPLIDAATLGALRRNVGSVQVTALLDGYIDIGSELVIGLAEADAERLARASFQKSGPRRAPVNAYLVNLGDRLVLVDAGTSDSMGPSLGRLPAAIEAAGVSPDQIDTLLITHMHPDHINGVLTPAGEALFPNAELVVTATDYAFWHDDANMNQAPDEAKPFFVGARRAAAAYADRLRQVDGEGEVVGAIRTVPLPGHTPGHAGFTIESDGEALFIWGDVVHMAAYQFARPDWSIAFDVDSKLAAETRKRTLDRVVADRILIAGMHLPFPGFGHVARDGQAYRFVPAEWAYEL
ncbi:MBL fold metallo-hydrolase [Mesorhizobium sp.]|uniref:MBL fold metallo-hydrolase n=1 Tax=Mesorhizobium sp. TaxID=1871066 RepID=UPI000FE85EA4|nr:MBL fold metallo-hydrolase [Mesorhizobium sp.]RWK31378.1 MAG: MBL fold metallo-hydrolase [Mesorhizobium sp.]RWK63344.1 MAG: MBL fold metallo-hydrolase [Mesorhizobium sp.]RWK71775.1 MAG: MBL fold metallo-hydrolase [Mesorhizobium sp.]RWK75063.1 MAG: MBL fold metallo-hydrolase [Mesorhizobium sp.]RWK99667.1 MAG: MBL fold metallo-hydrolase [Mesorhizobium sp.]